MDYRQMMTEAMARLMKPAKPSYPDNRAGRRAKVAASKRRGKGWTK